MSGPGGARPASASEGKRASPSKVMVVEDDTTLRETLALNLRSEGYEVLEAEDGEGGLELAREAVPDLIILDVMLPKLDGLTLCRILRRESRVPIILLTARGTETDKIIGLESGADDYVVKPFSLGELLARVRAGLRRPRAEFRRVEYDVATAARAVRDSGLPPRFADMLETGGQEHSQHLAGVSIG